ncbi:MAG: heme-binding protein [alpha proteobacterium HIMB59]|nr:MAG: heme-binding protein [alpha proteobacterium HIMB59]
MIKYILIFLFMIKNIMAYDEAPYQIMQENDNFEIRFYDERIVIQTSFQGSNSGFQKLFKYISGNNQSSTKIEMTTPVTMLPDQGQMVMQFFLPERFDLSSAPLPADDSVEIASIEEGYFAVIQYSGFASDKNFLKHVAILKNSLDQAQIETKGPAIKATYNGPFTLPNLRRNEAMFLVNWSKN